VPRLTALLLAVVLHATLAQAVVGRKGDLVSYSFDDGTVETGPDTFVVFEHANGRVDLSEDFYVTPYSSVVIEDVPGNGAFPELQGYFPEVDAGKVYVQFYLMPTQRDEELNIALAGPARFTIEPQGIALWFIFRNGRIEQVSDGIARVLLAHFDPFQWYRFEIVYDVDRGTYDVRVGIGDHGPTLVHLTRQPNAAGAPGSGVSIFSFIGDLRDRSAVRYYLDSLNVSRHDLFAADASDAPEPRPTPPPRPSLLDKEIALLRTELDVLDGFIPVRAASESRAVNEPYLAGIDAFLAHDPDRALRLLETALPKTRTAEERALVLNAHGVVQLHAGNVDAATRDFTDAVDAMTALPEPRLNLVLAAAKAHEWAKALGLAGTWAQQLRHDNRLLLLRVKIWMARDRFPEAAAELAAWDLRDEPLLEGYRLLLQIAGGHGEAVDKAAIDALLAAHAGNAELEELGGDLFFAKGDYQRALAHYRALAAPSSDPDRSVLIKAADCADRLGDLTQARALRERVYGRL
jgi:tetratricopeptide (TPR) repeat protein